MQAECQDQTCSSAVEIVLTCAPGRQWAPFAKHRAGSGAGAGQRSPRSLKVSLTPVLWEQHGFSVSWSCPGCTVPSFWHWPCHHAVFSLILTIRYLCNFGIKALLYKAWTSKACSVLDELHASTYTAFFCPIDSTWIKCKLVFKHFLGSGPECSDF